MKVLVVEDQPLFGKSLKRALAENGWTVELAIDGVEGLGLAQTTAYDVMILDWMLPKRSGLEVLKDLRRSHNTIPTIMMTAKGAVLDRVEGLNLGADDYIVKPFAMVELIARVKAIYRRSLGTGSSQLTIGLLTLDLARHKVLLGGESLDLTGKEFDLLAALAAKIGTLIKRDKLTEMLYELDSEPESNSLDVLLARLRKKLSGSSLEIETVRGKGFVLRADAGLS